MKWISTLDDLPKEATPVLIVHCGEVRIGEIRWDFPGFEDAYREFQYWDDPNNDGQCWAWGNVTHWMPIPAMPEESRDD